MLSFPLQSQVKLLIYLCQSSYKSIMRKVLRDENSKSYIIHKQREKMWLSFSYKTYSFSWEACLFVCLPYQPLYKILSHLLSACSLSLSLAFLIITFPFPPHEYVKTPSFLKHAVFVSYFTSLWFMCLKSPSYEIGWLNQTYYLNMKLIVNHTLTPQNAG